MFFSVCKVIENLEEHGIHCLTWSYINDVIDMLPKNYDAILMFKLRHRDSVLPSTKNTSL